MMKILLIFTLSFILGPVGCAVTGYLGGSIAIIHNRKWNSQYSGFFCKKERTSCRDIIRSRTLEDSVRLGRFLMYQSPGGFLAVLISRLQLQDAGTYRMGEKTWTTDVNLKVVNDSCCAEPKSLSASPGQNINIIFNYPVEYESQYKYIVKLDNYSVFKPVLDTSSQSRKSRFSVSEKKSTQVLSMNIRNVRETDNGVYFCVVFDGMNSVPYFSAFSEIQLLVKAKAPEEILSNTTQSSVLTSNSSDTIIIIISVCVCVTLLLIGGFALLIYKLKHKRTQDSSPSSQGTEQGFSVYENELPNLPSYENMKVRMASNYQNLDSSLRQSNSTYQTLDPLTNQADSGYTSLTTTTGQTYSQYQSLDPRTRDNSVYHTLQS